MIAAYEFSPKAEIDLEEIWEYIAPENVTAAERLIANVEKALENLSSFPHQGHRRTDLTSRPLRFRPVGEYLIAYAPDEMPLWVVAVMHGRRSPHIMTAILRGRE